MPRRVRLALCLLPSLFLSAAFATGGPPRTDEQSKEAARKAAEMAKLKAEMAALEKERQELLKRLAAAGGPDGSPVEKQESHEAAKPLPAGNPALAQSWLDGLAAARGLGRREALQRIGRVQVFQSSPPAIREIFSAADESALIRRGLQDLGLLRASDAPASLHLDLGTQSFLHTSQRSGQKQELRVRQIWATAAIHMPVTVLREGRFCLTDGVVASATSARIDVDRIVPATVSEVITEALRLLGQDLDSNRGPIRPDSEWREQFAGKNDALGLYRGFRESATATANGSRVSFLGIERLGAVAAGLSPLNQYQPLKRILGDFSELTDNPLFGDNNPLVGLLRKVTEWDPAVEWRESLARLALPVVAGGGAKTRPALLFGLSGTETPGLDTTLASLIGQGFMLDPECVADTPGGAIRFVCKTWDHVEIGIALPSGSFDRSSTLPGAAREVNRLAAGAFEEAYRRESAQARRREPGPALVPAAPVGPIDPRLRVAIDPKIAQFSVSGTTYGVAAVIDAYLRMNEGEKYQYALAFKDGKDSLFVAGIDREEELFRIYPLPMPKIRAELAAAGVAFFPAADSELSRALERKYPGYRLVSRSYSVTFKSLFSMIGEDGSRARPLGDLLAPLPAAGRPD